MKNYPSIEYFFRISAYYGTIICDVTRFIGGARKTEHEGRGHGHQPANNCTKKINHIILPLLG